MRARRPRAEHAPRSKTPLPPFLFGGLAVAATRSSRIPARHDRRSRVHRDPSCGCCEAWSRHEARRFRGADRESPTTSARSSAASAALASPHRRGSTGISWRPRGGDDRSCFRGAARDPGSRRPGMPISSPAWRPRYGAGRSSDHSSRATAGHPVFAVPRVGPAEAPARPSSRPVPSPRSLVMIAPCLLSLDRRRPASRRRRRCSSGGITGIRRARATAPLLTVGSPGRSGENKAAKVFGSSDRTASRG